MKIDFDDLLDGKIDEQEAKKALIELYEKGESVEDLVGAMTAMRARMIKVTLPKDIANIAIDNCGTGGDGLHTFNVSSIAAIVLASLGIFVAKHGNKSVTSKSGSADMFEALGVKLNLTSKQNVTLLSDSGFCFLFAQNYHPCMKFIMPIRKSLPHRTIFNILGPLCNPAEVKRHLIGVFDFEKAIKMAEALKCTNSVAGITVCSASGADEALPFETSNIASFNTNAMITYQIAPSSTGSINDLLGGDAVQNAKITLDILNNKLKGTALETVVLNAALGVVASGKTDNLIEAKEMALDGINSGKANVALQNIIKISNKL